MIRFLPGTTVELNIDNGAADFLNSLFAANGLVLSQVLQLTGLSAHTVQNWVKRKFVDPPVNKKYDCDQFCTIVMINMLNDIFQIDQIKKMIDYVGIIYGKNAPTLIYMCFVDLLRKLPEDAIREATGVDEIINNVIEENGITDPEAANRIRKVLDIMILTHISARIKAEASVLLNVLDE